MKLPMRNFRAISMIVVPLVLFSASPASAETFHLKSGKKVHGELIRESDKFYVVKTTQGFTTALLKEELETPPTGAKNPPPDPNTTPPTLALTGKPSTEPQPYLFLLQKRRFSELEKRLSELEASRARNDRGRFAFSRLVDSLGSYIAAKKKLYLNDLNAWIDASPQSHLPFLVRGAFYTDYAWEARGSGWASTVSDQAAKYFEERLASAKADLEKAAELNPKSAEAPTRLIVWAMALGDNENAQEYFEKATSIDPAYLPAYERRLMTLMEKWGGSNEAMLAFARLAKQTHAAADPAFNTLLIDAQAEAAARSADPESYHASDANWEEVSAAYRALIDAYPDSIYYRNAFAQFAFYAYRLAEAAEQFGVLGERFDNRVWSYKDYKGYREFAVQRAHLTLPDLNEAEAQAFLDRIRGKAAEFDAKVHDTARLVDETVLIFDKEKPDSAPIGELHKDIRIHTKGRKTRFEAVLRVPDELSAGIPDSKRRAAGIFDGKNGLLNSKGERKTAEAKDAVLYGLDSNPWTFVTAGSKVVGTEKVNGVPCRVIETEGLRFWYDAELDWLLQVEDGSKRWKFLEFKTLEGFTLPFMTKEYEEGRLVSHATIEKLEFNTGIEDSLFNADALK